MARQPKPWFRKSRNAWFVTVNGQQHNLGEDKKEAYERFHQLMLQPVQRKVSSQSLVALIDIFLEWVQKHRAPDTYEWYRYRLQRFAEKYPDLKTGDIRPYHAQEWVDEYQFSKTSKRNYLRSIKRCMTWALKQGYIDRNPIEYMEIPSADRKEVMFSQEEFDWLLLQFKDREIQDLLITTWETGCRPQESLRLEARHVDLKNSRWVFPESEGKTGVRIVYLTDKALEITKRLLLKFPEGKLFRNTRGTPWTTDSVNCRFYRIKKQGGKNFSLYALRHSWATHALQKGVDPLTVAILMGHKDPSMLSRVYQHLSHSPDHMLTQAKKAVG
jgi:integrase/recombinase XerD